jgi:hypothetical protein
VRVRQRPLEGVLDEPRLRLLLLPRHATSLSVASPGSNSAGYASTGR